MANLLSRTEAQEREADLIYRSLFGQAIPDTLSRRFIEAANADRSRHAADLDRYYRTVSGVRDLEALELAGRYMGKLPLLSRHFGLMVFLAETLPDHQRHFIKQRKSSVRAVGAVLFGALRTGYKLLKGLVLMRTRRG